VTLEPGRIDPDLVPRRTLASGSTIPAIGLGTFGSDHASADLVAAAVGEAIELGYRHIDCAAVYANEAAIGAVLERAIRGGVRREDLWVTSKLWNNRHAPKDVAPTFEQSLRDLRLDYLDLYLVHWPFPNTHEPGVDVGSRDSNARPYIHAAYMDTWGELERLVDRGLVRHIGTSNMTVPKLRLVLRDARIRPAANEMELHPHFQQPELFPSATRRSDRPRARTATAPRATRWTSRTRSSWTRPPGWAFTRRSCASSGPCSAVRCRSRSRPRRATSRPTSRASWATRSPTPRWPRLRASTATAG